MVIEILNGGKIFNSICQNRENQISRYLPVQSRIEILIGFEFRGISRYKFKFKFLFNLNLQSTKISPPFRISITIQFSISSLIFHGTGCTSHSIPEIWSRSTQYNLEIFGICLHFCGGYLEMGVEPNTHFACCKYKLPGRFDGDTVSDYFRSQMKAHCDPQSNISRKNKSCGVEFECLQVLTKIKGRRRLSSYPQRVVHQRKASKFQHGWTQTRTTTAPMVHYTICCGEGIRLEPLPSTP